MTAGPAPAPRAPWAAAARALPVLAIGLLGLVASASGILQPLEWKLDALRMSLSARPATGDVVHVAVDARSLEEVGVWPWPRSVHADILDRLVAAGARDVLFDFDFAFAGDPAGDAAFVAALERAGGSAYLAAFSQVSVPTPGGPAEVTSNLPHAPFREASWPASVNVPPDRDGMIRRYAFEGPVAGEDIPSAAALLAGTFGPPGRTFEINFAIRADTVPTHSASDVLRGAVPDAAFAGRSVVVGAHALELRDSFAVPVHGIVPGPVLHILAAETLATGLVPLRVGATVPIVASMLVLALLRTRRHDFSPWALILGMAGAVGAVEAAALLLFRSEAVLLATAPLYPGVLAYGLWRLGRALDVSAFLVRGTRAEVANARRLLDQVFADSSDMIVVVDEGGRVLSASRSAVPLLGAAGGGPDALPGPLAEAARSAVRTCAAGLWAPEPAREAEVAGRILEFSVTPSRLDVARRGGRGAQAGTVIATVSARDVTEPRRQRARLDYLATHDERTGALQRSAFLRLLEDRLRAADATDADADADAVSVFAVDLHRFKTINATLGRDVGDRLLRAVVDRLRAEVAGLSHPMRLGGDCFAVLHAGPRREDAPARIAEAIERAVAAPYVLGRDHARVGARIGHATSPPGGGMEAGDLLGSAEDALDAASLVGGTQTRPYDPAQAARRARSREIERAMWGAIENDEFDVAYQPQVDMRDGRLLGVEALIRWTSPTLGPVYPDQFIELAEANGFIRHIGRWILGRATRDAARLPDDVTLAVNVSPVQMVDTDLVGDVRAALRESGLPARRLWLELTESAFVSGSNAVVETMLDIEMLGVRWALDDFGTGYSSLSYLSTLPLRKLKLDKGFVQPLGTDPNALAIVRSVGTLCRGMGIGFLCEGVETEAHRLALLRERCVEGQGYLYGKPQSLDEVVAGFALAGPERTAASA